MKRIFLSSYFAKVQNLFKDFIKEDLKEKKLLFIPTASIVEEINFYVEEAKVAFKNLGMKLDILELTAVNESEAKEKISAADYLYVSGGNTFFLLQELKRKKLLSLIVEKVNNGMVYIGESAGTMIATADIEYAEGMDNKDMAKDLDNTKALNLIDFYPLVHYGEFPFVEVSEQREKKYKNKLNLIKINNEQAIIVEDEKISVI